MRMVYLYQFEIRKKYIVFRVCSNGMENFSYYEYLNSISFHPPVMIITTLVFLTLFSLLFIANSFFGIGNG